MARDDESFLARWARRKQRPARPPGAEAGHQTPAAAPPPESAADPEAERAAEARRQELVDSLPDPDTLGPDDDFAQFLQEGVPEQLRQRALRRLWRSNPVFANLDRLVDYDHDYTDAATVVENLKTAYKVGRGMVDETAPAAAESVEPPAGQTAPAESPDEAAHADADADADADAQSGDRAPASEPPSPAAAEQQDDAVDPAPEPAPARRPRGQAARRRWGGDAA